MSRLFPAILSLATNFASSEVAAATPYVEKAIAELPGDLRSAQPLAALTKTVHDAMTAMYADSNVVPSFTGILGAAIKALF